jgi:hypothetical protein
VKEAANMMTLHQLREARQTQVNIAIDEQAPTLQDYPTTNVPLSLGNPDGCRDR